MIIFIIIVHGVTLGLLLVIETYQFGIAFLCLGWLPILAALGVEAAADDRDEHCAGYDDFR